jgi:hypothetical protein
MIGGCLDVHPEIRIWTFNNSIRGISDQVEFLWMNFSRHGYRVVTSNRPSPNALNVLIENLDERTYSVVADFADRYRKKIAVVMTEHVDFIGERIYFHGMPLSSPSEYIHALTRRERLLRLMVGRNFIRWFIRLGDLPVMRGFDEMFPGIQILTMPFPGFRGIDRKLSHSPRKLFDLAFSGAMTSHRRQVLQSLKEKFNINEIDQAVSRRRRDGANASAKAVLNIPQDTKWAWVSNMRIMAAWRCGKPVINIGLGMEGKLGEFCLNVAPNSAGMDLIAEALKAPDALYRKQKEAFDQYVASKESPLFPDLQFRLWALMELNDGVSLSPNAL